MNSSSQANALSDARIEIARISDSSNEQILEQQIAYAAGYIRCAQDQMLISADQWVILLAEIEAEKQSWRGRQAALQK
ncbi:MULTISPECIES: hypothetical protein [Pseudomonas syringae group]|uniref:Uncharacterized protein n=1 Tax=Pseudomonas avellanae pv. morsprunorum TaxID=3380385 RepID=A0ABX4YR24_9PSED|nr:MULTISPECIES: hypothetical protein [Pseudomonas syringae group]KWS65231.1 hypothetical protein AL055_23145 [Pseudomonas amygdali pv. morsprunorum]POC82827.1 hypothetical protein BKM26_26100 [Pseudomonas avellanae]POD00352.1 hypothetical protein BKM20_26315 [Pseudomonas avellanae]POD14549.1 hypothetical protein BKM05_26450 [Pseudomonas avellanae]SPF11158.1 hypothetical protein PSCFBP3800_01106 [Pseudomonas syringae group genomosp. 3]